MHGSPPIGMTIKHDNIDVCDGLSATATMDNHSYFVTT